MKQRNLLRQRHGEALNRFWQAHSGYAIDSLTGLEACPELCRKAPNLCRQPSLVAIQDFLAQAAVEARGRGLEVAVGRGG